MNQTIWIIGGGAVIIGLAAVLYVQSGSTKISPTDITINDSYQKSPVATETPAASGAPTTMTEETKPTATPKQSPGAESPIVTLHTSMGDITVKLYQHDAPKTVENFTKLVSEGFYNGIKFHRVIKGFMIQGGDPNTKDDSKQDSWGMGGPGYKFADEINQTSSIYQRGYKHGVLAMANSGPNTNGSQFFIMAKDYPLPPLYTIFGEVISGLDVVDAIDVVATDASDRPLTPVIIKSAALAK